jgi:hypothetical protein
VSLVTAQLSLAVACVGLGALAVAGSGWLAFWVPRFDPRARSQGTVDAAG